MNRNEIDLNDFDLQKAKRVAEEAAYRAGAFARSRFGGTLNMKDKDDFGDLVTEVDILTDDMIVSQIKRDFPDHLIESEEAGQTGKTSDFTWHVDPLDGTNNYALGIPLYGVSISLSYKGKPILGVVRDSHLEQTYTAVIGEGSQRGNEWIRTRPAAQMRKGTISWIQGHAVPKNDTQCIDLRYYLESQMKRVLRVWAPSLTWAMLARGDIHGIVLYNSAGPDLYAGVLLMQEAGGLVTDYNGNEVDDLLAVQEPYLVAAHPDNHARLLQWVRQGMKMA